MGSLYEMSSERRLEIARYALYLEGIKARSTRARVVGSGPWLGVSHTDAQTDLVRETVLRVDGSAHKR